MNFKTLIITLIIFNSVYSQKKDPYLDKYAMISPDYYKNYLFDSGDLIISPLDWSWKNYAVLGLVTGAAMITYNNDEYISDIFRSNKNDINDNIAFAAEKLGNGFYVTGGLVTSYLVSNMIDNDRLRRTSLLALESFAITGIFAQSFKHLIHRHRPYENDGPYEFDGPSFSNSSLSLPSGHSATVFSTAKIINGCYSENKFLPYITYPLAFITAVSRIYDNKHWPSDILLGAAFGYYSASVILDSQKKKAFQFALIPSTENVTLNLSYNF
ncbi:MAG: phosphatase PAP2 family protein [Candidatus Delongbacteria bacterium]|nr:phosphatase PAP2 family protein [Candidatus Delongbacteria bacterium]